MVVRVQEVEICGVIECARRILNVHVDEVVPRMGADEQNNLAIVFDKAGELVMIYTDPRFDYTDFVLDELGLGDPNDKIKN